MLTTGDESYGDKAGMSIGLLAIAHRCGRVVDAVCTRAFEHCLGVPLSVFVSSLQFSVYWSSSSSTSPGARN